MRYVYGKRMKTLRDRIVTGVSALALLANTAGMSLPSLLAQRATAAPYVSTATTGFNVLANWQDDRSAPSGGFTLSDSLLSLGVDGDAPDSKAAGNAFYRTEGRQAELPAGTNSIKATLHVDAVWASVIGVRAGIWGVTSDSPAYYPILEFSNRNDTNDQVAGTPVIRAWDSGTDSWINVITNPTYGADYTFEIVHNPYTSTFEYYVNDSAAPVLTASATTNTLSNVIFNSYNSGIANNDYTVQWTNFETGIKLPEPAVSNTAFVSHDAANYAGVFVEFSVSDFSNATDAYVTIERANGGDVVKRINPAKLGEYLNDGAARTLTVPFPIIERTYTEAGSSSWMPMTNNSWDLTTVPTFAYATVVTPEGNKTDTKLPFSGTYNANFLATPSTNDINKINGWAHVNELNKNVGSVELEFVSERNFWSCFEYRTDGDTSQIVNTTNPNLEVTDGQYPDFCLKNETQVHTISANEYVEVRMVYGAEKDERFGWTRFNVLADNNAPEVSGVVLNGKTVAVARDFNCGPTDFNLVSGKINLSATITDNSSGVKSATYKIRKVTDSGCTQTGIYQSGTVSMSNQSSNDWVTLPGTELDTADVPADGNYTIMMTVADNAGNSATKYIDITVDNTAPEMPIHLSPANNSSQNFNNFWFDWTDVSDAVSYEVRFSQNNSTDSNGSLNVGVWSGDASHNQPTESRAWSSGANGTWYWQVRSVDAAGNKSAWTTPWKMTIDMVAPDVPDAQLHEDTSGDSVPNGGFTDEQYFYFLLNSSDDTTRYQLKYWNDIPGSIFKESTPWTQTNLSGYMPAVFGTYEDNFTQGEGVHYFAFSACDAANNCSTYSTPYSVTYDKTAPSLDILAITTGDTEVEGTVDGDAASVEVSFDDGITWVPAVYTPGETSWTSPIPPLSDGVHTVLARATDAAGNTTDPVAEETFEIGGGNVLSDTDLDGDNQSDNSQNQNRINPGDEPEEELEEAKVLADTDGLAGTGSIVAPFGLAGAFILAGALWVIRRQKQNS